MAYIVGENASLLSIDTSKAARSSVYKRTRNLLDIPREQAITGAELARGSLVMNVLTPPVAFFSDTYAWTIWNTSTTRTVRIHQLLAQEARLDAGSTGTSAYFLRKATGVANIIAPVTVTGSRFKTGLGAETLICNTRNEVSGISVQTVSISVFFTERDLHRFNWVTNELPTSTVNSTIPPQLLVFNPVIELAESEMLGLYIDSTGGNNWRYHYTVLFTEVSN